MNQFWHESEMGHFQTLLDRFADRGVGFRSGKLAGDQRFEIRDLKLGFEAGGESVLVNGAVFKTVSETVRTGSGRFDSYTPPPDDCGFGIANCGFEAGISA